MLEVRRKQVGMDASSSLRVAAELSELETIHRFVEQHATALRIDPSAIDDLLLVVNEIATNSILHGYRKQPGTIEVAMRPIGDAVEICVRDHAPPFDPTQALSPDLHVPLAQRPLGGMGVHLARQLIDSLTYHITPDGWNELTLVKYRIVPHLPQEEPDGSNN